MVRESRPEGSNGNKAGERVREMREHRGATQAVQSLGEKRVNCLLKHSYAVYGTICKQNINVSPGVLWKSTYKSVGPTSRRQLWAQHTRWRLETAIQDVAAFSNTKIWNTEVKNTNDTWMQFTAREERQMSVTRRRRWGLSFSWLGGGLTIVSAVPAVLNKDCDSIEMF